VRRFLDAVAGPPAASVVAGGSPLRLSARNQITATALAVTHGDVMSTIKVALPDGQQLTAAITRDAAEELDLAPGDPVVVVVKSTEVMIAR
jgi:molybdate transport system regulatory protein